MACMDARTKETNIKTGMKDNIGDATRIKDRRMWGQGNETRRMSASADVLEYENRRRGYDGGMRVRMHSSPVQK
ncbi:hypothetical protein JTE90_008508 [Oedothorax gibbosus]|uniref:Uncharacterized protein n=1 Tax=Oedothorax gibbosus TaxID=931172 RepID=A0AAV6V0E2_9ARAC|nr:hypothetical protein JTE90_008508 [Oedothorax gibbosus]